MANSDFVTDCHNFQGGGLISSTLLDTLITPVVFWLVGRKPVERLTNDTATQDGY
ncbi:hypothetical protein WCLP8_3270006 [uncultured Gammaproteobacteria bacterium]